MDENAERYRKVADRFTELVRAVPLDRWDDPSPCEGWVARDVVGHLVEWLPSFFCGTWGLPEPDLPSVASDPAGAWIALDATFTAALADPAVSGDPRDTPMGRMTFGDAVSMICTTDILIHSWDLARATGLDETLDPDEVHRYAEGMEPIDALLRESGHYGPRVPVADDADEQTRLLAFLGRVP